MAIGVGAFIAGSTIAPASAGPNSSANREPAFEQISAGGGHTCAILDTGTLTCWGDNSLGQLGLGDTVNRGDGVGPVGETVDLGDHTAKAVAAGDAHTCVIIEDGRVTCFGLSVEGALGLGFGAGLSYFDPNQPVDPLALIGDSPSDMGDGLRFVDLGTGRTATAISAGGHHTCAILDNGVVKCWGDSSFGQAGRPGVGGTNSIGDQPDEMGADLAALPLGDDAVAISAGGIHTCAVLASGGVKCWGYGQNGRLGYGNENSIGDSQGEIDSLGTVSLPRSATAISAGGYHTCAVLDDATVRCWGFGAYGALGYGSATSMRSSSIDDLPAVDLGQDALGVDTGDRHTCALLADSSVKCWGYGDSGQRGSDDTGSAGWTPNSMGVNLPAVPLGTGRTARAIETSPQGTCAVLDNATVKCWGVNASGQLGQGNTDSLGDEPGEMASLQAIAIGGTIQASGLAVTLQPGTSSVTKGDNVTFTLTLTKTGRRTATDVNISVPGTSGCSGPSSAPSEGSPVVATCTATATVVGTLTRTATVTTGDFVGDSPVTAVATSSAVTVQALPSYRPDGLVRVGTKAFVGNNVYNTTAKNQTVSSKVKPGKKATYTVRVQNDGNVTDTYTVKGAKSTSKFTVTYLRGGKDITTAVTAGTYKLTSLKKATNADITVTVKPTKKAVKGNSLKVSVLLTSATAPTKKDTVALATTRT